MCDDGLNTLPLTAQMITPHQNPHITNSYNLILDPHLHHHQRPPTRLLLHQQPSYSSYLSSLPRYVQYFLPPHINEDDLDLIVHAYSENKMIGAVNSLVTGVKGIFSYTIAIPSNPSILTFHGATTSSHTNLATKRSELLSLLAILYIIILIRNKSQQRHTIEISSTSTYLSLLLDEIDQWGNLPKQHQLKLHLQNNYDLVSLLYYLYIKWHAPIVILKDSDLKNDAGEIITNGETMRKELSAAQLEETTIIPQIHIFHHIPTTRASLWKDQFHLHSDIDNLIYFYTHGPALRQYIINKTNWDPSTFDKVAWQAFFDTYHKRTSRKQTLICKYVHNWQNVGSQKIKIDSNTTEELCPMGCGKAETPMHFWYCPEPCFTTIKQDQLKKLEEHMETNNTCPEVKQEIITRLHFWVSAQEEPTHQIQRDEDGNPDNLSQAIDDQNEIGWDQFLKGRLSLQWINLQHKYCLDQNLQPKYDGFNWASKLIKKILDVSLLLWDFRNKLLRGFNYAESIFIQRQKLTKQIKHAYDHYRDEVKPHFQTLFQKSLPNLLKHSVSYLHTWTHHYNIARNEWKCLHPTETKSRQTLEIQQRQQRTSTRKKRIRKHASRTDVTKTGKRRPPNTITEK